MFLMVSYRDERPQQLLPVLLCEHSAADPLCHLGAGRPTGQVRRILIYEMIISLKTRLLVLKR